MSILIPIEAETSAKYNIQWYGLFGFQIHSQRGKVLQIFNRKGADPNDHDIEQNYTDAVNWGIQNKALIND